MQSKEQQLSKPVVSQTDVFQGRPLVEISSPLLRISLFLTHSPFLIHYTLTRPLSPSDVPSNGPLTTDSPFADAWTLSPVKRRSEGTVVDEERRMMKKKVIEFASVDAKRLKQRDPFIDWFLFLYTLVLLIISIFIRWLQKPNSSLSTTCSSTATTWIDTQTLPSFLFMLVLCIITLIFRRKWK